jgi:hypothetical protein
MLSRDTILTALTALSGELGGRAAFWESRM